MKKIVSGIGVLALALSGAVITGSIAQAAPATTTLVMSGGNGVFELGPVVINGTASAAGAVEFSVNGKVVPGCEAVATATVSRFKVMFPQYTFMLTLFLLVELQDR